MKRIFTHADVAAGVTSIAERYRATGRRGIVVYGVPRGGIPIAYMLTAHGFVVTGDPSQANLIVDDVRDSGETARRYIAEYRQALFYPLVEKRPGDGWVTFPWEQGDPLRSKDGGEDIVTRLLQYIGEDAGRGGLIETPRRVLSAWRDWTAGYGQKPEDVLKCFKDGADGVDEMVVVRDLPFYSQCEHHLAPFFGTATIAYIPQRRIVGLSKLSRLLDIYARRLQVQERLTNQVADALWENLNPLGVGVLVRARHLCMESRGICKQGHETVTSALRGCIKTETSARAEFLGLA